MYKTSIQTKPSGLACMLICLAAATGNPATAQITAPFLGSWKANWQTDRKTYDAVMNVTDKGGTWQTYTRDKNNPCAGREVPMKIESSGPSEVQLLLQFSEVIPGCSNPTVTLKAAPDGTVTGMRSKFELTLVKQ